MFWNVRAIPRCAISWRGLPVMSSPAKSTLPSVGRFIPVITLKAVVFPAPFGPMRPTISSFSIRTSRSRHGGEAAEAHGDASVLSNAMRPSARPGGPARSRGRRPARDSIAHENSRFPMSPRCRNSTTAMSRAENTTMRSPGRAVGPETRRFSGPSRKRSASIRIVTPMDAITEPVMEPMPPSTTTRRMLNVSRNVNIFGSMVVSRCPRSAPPTPAMKLETVKLTTLVRNTFTPMEPAAISSSRTALSALARTRSA